MDVKINNLIKLNDNKEYVVVSKAKHKENEYIFIVDINHNKNFKIMQLTNDRNIFEVDLEKEKNLVNELLPMFLNNCKEKLEINISNE